MHHAERDAIVVKRLRPIREYVRMRSFNDAQGGHWQAAVLDASYGNTLVVFSHEGSSVIRQAVLDAENLRIAEQQLLAMDDAQLRVLLADSVAWP